MQTILGVGNLGRELAKSLTPYTHDIRLVGRNPVKIQSSDELFEADLTDPEQTLHAVEHSEIVYLTVGLPYNTKIWQEQWPLVMRNVIQACKVHKAKLVFFDNVYMYGKVAGWMTEETPINSHSEKGKVRAELTHMLQAEMRQGDIQVLIARSADFYGPDVPTSAVAIMVFDNLHKGKKAQWMVNANVPHSMTYVPDAARALALLGNTESAYNQIWHLPTDHQPITGKEFIALAAKAFNVAPRYTVLTKSMLWIIGLFLGVVRENMEVLYQNEAPYLFDSRKFLRSFDFDVTPYEQGIAATVRSYVTEGKG